MKIVINDILALNFSKIHFVIGFVNDKSLELIVDLFPKNANYYFCKPNIERGLDSDELKSIFESKSRYGTAYESVEKAYTTAKDKTSNKKIINIGGSTLVVSEII